MTNQLESPNAAVHVLLTSGKEITSPIMPRETAEDHFQQIARVHHQGGDVTLPWISIRCADIEALHVQPRAALRAA